MRWNHQEEQKLEIIHILKYCSGFAVFGGSNITWFSCFGPHSSPLQWDVNNLSGKANISRTSHAWAYKSSIRLNQEAADALIHANPGPRGIPLWSVPRLSSTSRPSPRCGWYPGRDINAQRPALGQLRPDPLQQSWKVRTAAPTGTGSGDSSTLIPAPGAGNHVYPLPLPQPVGRGQMHAEGPRGAPPAAAGTTTAKSKSAACILCLVLLTAGCFSLFNIASGLGQSNC